MATGEGYGGGSPGERALNRDFEGQDARLCLWLAVCPRAHPWLPRLPIDPFPDTGGVGQPRFISRDWLGLPGQVDAAMAGHIYISSSTPRSSQIKMTKSKHRNRKRYRSHRGRGHSRRRSQNPHRKSRSVWLPLFSSEESGPGAYNYDYEMDWLVPATCEPIQSVYFFSGGGNPASPISGLLSLLPMG